MTAVVVDEQIARTAQAFRAHVDLHRVVRLHGELDCSTSADLMAAFSRFNRETGDIFVDLADLQFIDAAGLNTLCLAASMLGARGRVVLCRAPPLVTRLVEIAGLCDELYVTP